MRANSDPKTSLPRVKAVTVSECAEAAVKAAARRWFGDIRRALPHSNSCVLRAGSTGIPGYVLEDGTRVISRCVLLGGIGMPGGERGVQRLADFLEDLARKGVDCKDVLLRVRSPLVLRPVSGGQPIRGYPATIFVDICRAVLRARRQELLARHQISVGDQCERWSLVFENLPLA